MGTAVPAAAKKKQKNKWEVLGKLQPVSITASDQMMAVEAEG